MAKRMASAGALSGRASSAQTTTLLATAPSATPTAHGSKPASCALAASVSTVTVVSNAPSIANRTSATACTRCFGFFSRQRCRNTERDGDTADGRRLQFGSRWSTLDNVIDTSSPSNTLRPVSISRNTTPNAQISDRLSTRLPTRLFRRHIRRRSHDHAHLGSGCGERW